MREAFLERGDFFAGMSYRRSFASVALGRIPAEACATPVPLPSAFGRVI